MATKKNSLPKHEWKASIGNLFLTILMALTDIEKFSLSLETELIRKCTNEPFHYKDIYILFICMYCAILTCSQQQKNDCFK